MKRIHSFAALAALSLIGGLTIAASPAATAAVAVAPAAAAVSYATNTHQAVPAFTTTCVDQNVQFVVNATMIHIKSAPDSTDLYTISKTAFFDSFPLCYSSNVAGQHWVYGFSNAHTGHVGWVGCEYLTGCVALIGS